ncbi:MAG: UrcA family protein [Pseudomonadota bacterium]
MLKLLKKNNRTLIAAAIIGGVCSPLVYADDYAISYRNAELTTIEGRIAVHKRILSAAKAHCPRYTRTKSLRDVANCVDDVVSDLVEQIDNPQFTAFVSGASGLEFTLAESGRAE